MKTDAEILKEGLIVEILLKVNEKSPGNYDPKSDVDLNTIKNHLSHYKHKAEEMLNLISRYEKAESRSLPKEVLKFDRIERNTASYKIKETLKNYPNGLTARQVHSNTEMSLGNAYRILGLLKKEGSVEHTDGLYILKAF